MTRRIRLGVVGLCAALALTGCTGASAETSSGFTVFPAAARHPAPQLTGDLLDGGTYDIGAYAGDVVVINWWASWCGPCTLEAPGLEETYQAMKSDRVTFVGVNTRERHDAAAAFAADHLTYPIIFDPLGKLGARFAAPSIPATIIIDRHGRVAAVAYGYVLKDTLEPVVTQLAAES
jgi:thiol-disulfide isomerase/thioredoxin